MGASGIAISLLETISGKSHMPDLYSRVTTKSNTFTVHVKRAVAEKVREHSADQWCQVKTLCYLNIEALR
jgi:hypothetical protein